MQEAQQIHQKPNQLKFCKDAIFCGLKSPNELTAVK